MKNDIHIALLTILVLSIPVQVFLTGCVPTQITLPSSVTEVISPSPTSLPPSPTSEPAASAQPLASARELFQLEGITSDDVEYMQFTQNRETQHSWRTSDPDIITDVLTHFGGLHMELQHYAPPVGSYLSLHIQLKDKAFLQKVTLSTPTVYHSDLSDPNECFLIVQGAKTEKEWDVILDQCEKIR